MIDPGCNQSTIDEDLSIIEAILEADPDSLETQPFIRQLEFHQTSFEVRQKVWACDNCSLRKSCTKPVPLMGFTFRPTVVALGEAPGEKEDLYGRGFCGPSGALISACAKDLKIEISDFVNVCCCRPPGNRTPHNSEVFACSGNLEMQMELIDPWIILTFGAVPLQAATDNNTLKVTRDHGVFFTTKFNHPDNSPIWGYSFYHPSYVLRAMSQSKKPTRSIEDEHEKQRCIQTMKLWEEDWRRLKEVVVLREMFGVKLLEAPRMNLMTLDQAIMKTMFENPYRGHKQTYLDKMEAKKDG